MLKENTYQILKKLRNECSRKIDKTISYKFFKKDKYKEYKLYLEKLGDSRYIKIVKKFYVEHESWIIKVKPKGHVYIKCYEGIDSHQKKYYIEAGSETENFLSHLPMGVWGNSSPKNI